LTRNRNDAITQRDKRRKISHESASIVTSTAAPQR
jgi:hypothetical protein